MLTETKGKLVFIPISKLAHHPDNPRKDLGDLTELTDSIKKSGVLQNLTVVPWFSKITGVGVADPKPQEEMGYYVVIGNRRLEASKKAGLKELPCVIAEMSRQEQVSTMLVENMQRTDLTYYEQAQGFQMMLDLGETQTSIAEKTGFSPATVSRRLQLTKLDQDKLKEVSTGRQISLNDLESLNKIESIDKRNELLDQIGTSSFNWMVKSAIDSEKAKKKENAWREVLLGAGLTEIDNHWDSRYTYCNRNSLSCDTNPQEYTRADDEQYFRISYGSIYFRKDKPTVKEDASAADESRKQQEIANQKLEELKAASKRAYELRREFAESITNAIAKKHFADIVTYAFYSGIMWGSSFIEEDDLLSLLNLEWQFDDEENSYINYDYVEGKISKEPEKMLWLMIYESTGDSERQTYHQYWNIKHNPNEELSAMYDILTKLGYEMSDEEKQLRDGTHRLFAKVDEQ